MGGTSHNSGVEGYFQAEGNLVGKSLFSFSGCFHCYPPTVKEKQLQPSGPPDEQRIRPLASLKRIPGYASFSQNQVVGRHTILASSFIGKQDPALHREEDAGHFSSR